MGIGCLECGEPSELLSWNVDRAQAERLGARFADEIGPHDWGGQGMVVAFPIGET